MLCPYLKITSALRLAGLFGLLAIAIPSMADKKPELDGEVTTYISIHSAKEVSGLGVASIYNQKSYCQLRYNYEDTRTFSFFWGRPFSKQGKNYALQVVPMLGVSAGNFMGVSPGIQLFAQVKQFEIFSSSQTSICANDLNRSFFFSWNEVQYNFKNILRTGVALQYTKQYPALQRHTELPQAAPVQLVDVGPMIGVQYWRLSMSGYLFNVWSDQRHYAVSLTYSFK